MKKLRFIFVFIFLTGMIYTVFQYIPILEEESHTQRMELAKKAKQTNTDSDNDLEDEDCDDDSESDFKYNFATVLTSFYTNPTIHSTNRHNLYKHQLDNIHTPPPEA